MPGPRGMLCLMLLIVAVQGKCTSKLGNKNKNITAVVSSPMDQELEKENFTPTVQASQLEDPDSTLGDEGRIAGGTSGQIASYNYLVHFKLTLIDTAITTPTECGGALLNDLYAVTSAQCVFYAKTIDVYAGIADFTTLVLTTSGTATIHPGFRRYSLINDIALVKFFSTIDFNTVTAGPVALPKGSKASFVTKLDGLIVRTAGFGVDASNTSPGTLMYVDQTQITRTKCDSKMLDKWISYPTSMSCLDPASAAKGQCSGDLGDPVLYKFSGAPSYVLVGVISDVTSCGINYPGAYTRIQPFISWISSQVKDLTYYS